METCISVCKVFRGEEDKLKQVAEELEISVIIQISFLKADFFLQITRKNFSKLLFKNLIIL